MKRSKSSARAELLTFGGRRVVEQALRSNHIHIERILVSSTTEQSSFYRNLRGDILQLGVRIDQMDPAQLEKLTGQSHHQGIACQVRSLPRIELEEVVEAKRNIVALDQVQDPSNLGAIIRSANAAGVGGVVVPQDRSAKLTAAAVKASAGAALHTPVIEVTNLARTLDKLKKSEYWIVALTASEAAENIMQFKPHTPWVLVVGSEGTGLRPLVEKQADFRVTIPMYGQVESLNVSAASAIALFQLTKSTI